MVNPSDSTTLWDALFDEPRLPDAVAVKLEADTAMAPVVAWLRTVTLSGAAAAVRQSLADSLQAALGLTLGDILGEALSTYKDLLEYTDSARHPPGEVSLVPLGKRVIESSHKPYVEVLIAGQPVGRLELKARVALTIEAAMLKIRGGRIWELQTGVAFVDATLECGPAMLVEKKSRNLKLPGTIAFAGGVAIALNE